MIVGRIVASVTIENGADLSKVLQCELFVGTFRRGILNQLMEFYQAGSQTSSSTDGTF